MIAIVLAAVLPVIAYGIAVITTPPSITSLVIALAVFVIPLLIAFTLYRLALLFAPAAYARNVSNNTVSVDKFVGQPGKAGTKSGISSKSALKSNAYFYFNGISKRAIKQEGYHLVAEESDKVLGLKVTSRDAGAVLQTSEGGSKPPPVVVGTIRMGFGHHRIAYAATSWGLGESDRETWFHDFLNIDSEEAQMIKDMDKAYSKGSRLASEIGGPVEKMWGGLTKAGDEDSLRATYQFAEHMTPLLKNLDKDSPIIATHSMVACAAVAAGFKNVINLVIDNHAQWFCLAPNCLNLVQGPSNYHSYLAMGVKEEYLQLAGHWIPRDLVEGIPSACARRNSRRKSDKPLRIIIPVGGAGAQRKFIVALVKAMAPLVKVNKVQLFLNAGDHDHMKEAFVGALKSGGMEYDSVVDMKGLQAFKEKMLSGEPSMNVTLFTYTDYFTAVATTDILCNVADVLACKPSELAFYPIPKLMIRRVGDHEAYSAYRASELGDGTLEVREVEGAVQYVKIFLTTNVLEMMNKKIEDNCKIGLYDGCKNAVKIALERAEKMSS